MLAPYDEQDDRNFLTPNTLCHFQAGFWQSLSQTDKHENDKLNAYCQSEPGYDTPLCSSLRQE